MSYEKETVDRKKPVFVKIIGLVMAGLTMATVVAFLFGWIVMMLWNALLPSMFHFPVLTYWQAVGLTLLSKILFSGFGHHPGAGKHQHLRKHLQFCKGDEEWCISGETKKFKHYEQFWNEEGKKAFDQYLEKKGISG